MSARPRSSGVRASPSANSPSTATYGTTTTAETAQVEAGGGGDRDEGVELDPVPYRPRGHRKDDRSQEHGAPETRGGTGGSPGQPQHGERPEVQHRLPREGGQSEQNAGEHGGRRPSFRVRLEEPLEAPPQEEEHHRLRPEVRREPDELGKQRGDGRGDEARA